MTIFEKTGNHIPLCMRCHNTISAKFDWKYVVGASIEPKVSFLNSRRMPTDTWHPTPVKVLPSYRE